MVNNPTARGCGKEMTWGWMRTVSIEEGAMGSLFVFVRRGL